jgi:dTDP-4-dehydrorhamnose reductase
MRVLIIGASGQLGRALHASFATDHDVIATGHRAPAPGQRALDLADEVAVRATLEATRPELVLIAGAMCDVDGCERDPEACRRVNTRGPARVAEWAAGRDARVVFYSTDHVFDSARDGYRESDPVRPLNVYARSKAEAEAAILERLPERALVLRTSWLYGPDAARRNFILRCVDRMRTGQTMRVPADQSGNPTYTEDLAHATSWLVAKGHAGTFHASGPECLDRVALARAACARFGVASDGIVPTPTRELGQAAPRPARVRLDSGKLRDAGAEAFLTLERGLERLAAWDATVARH